MRRRIAQKHLSEMQLDILARTVAVRADPDKSIVDPHISMCVACKAEFEMLLELYRVTAQELKAPHDLRIKNLAASSLPPGFVSLKPFHPKSEEMPDGEQMLLLAAQGSEAKPSRYHHVGTFASERAQTLVRVIRDVERKEIHMHLLTPVPSEAAHLLLAAAIPGKDTYVAATDVDGKATLPDPEGTEWNEVTMLVSPLVASFSRPFREGIIHTQSKAGPFLDVIDSSAGLQITICNFEGSSGGHLLVVGEDGSATVFQAHESKVLLPSLVTRSLRELRLFH